MPQSDLLQERRPLRGVPVRQLPPASREEGAVYVVNENTEAEEVTPAALDFCLESTSEQLLDAIHEAHERGLSPPDNAERLRRRVQALAYLARHGKHEQSTWATQELKQGRDAAVRRKSERT